MDFLTILCIFALSTGHAFEYEGASKINILLQKSMERSRENFDIVISLKDGVDSVFQNFDAESVPLTIQNRGERISRLRSQLIDHSISSQSKLLKLISSEKSRGRTTLQDLGVEQMWISNEIFVNGADRQLISELSKHPDVLLINEQIVLKLPNLEVLDANEIAPKQGALEWGVEKIKAKTWWDMGFNGTGIIVGTIDSGVRGTHRILKNSYVGENGWFDPQNIAKEPRDFSSNSHGTHTLGTIVGAEGVGVAPGAKWISCAGCPDDNCPQLFLVQCGQWMLCPDQKCAKTPRVINNSWGGGGGLSFYDSVISAWHRAEIIPIFAAGNSGPQCSTLGSPGDHRDVIGVGATTQGDSIASFSSLGPQIRYGSSIFKPDISAPGDKILSSINSSDDSLGLLSGTSMACPHVTGAVALMLSNNSLLTFEQIRNSLLEGAYRNVNGNLTACGSLPSNNQWPNHIFGHGRLDMPKVKQSTPSPTSPPTNTPSSNMPPTGTTPSGCSKNSVSFIFFGFSIFKVFSVT